MHSIWYNDVRKRQQALQREGCLRWQHRTCMWHWSEPGRIYEGSEEQAGYQLVTTAIPQLRPHHPEMFTPTEATTATTTTTTTTNRVNSKPVGFTASPQVTLLSSATKQTNTSFGVSFV